jgi:hypothetical protein
MLRKVYRRSCFSIPPNEISIDLEKTVITSYHLRCPKPNERCFKQKLTKKLLGKFWDKKCAKEIRKFNYRMKDEIENVPGLGLLKLNRTWIKKP